MIFLDAFYDTKDCLQAYFIMDNVPKLDTNLYIIEKGLKALEIIKEKRVNIECLKCCDIYEQYKTVCSYWNEITKEDFDSLKEVFDYEL